MLPIYEILKKSLKCHFHKTQSSKTDGVQEQTERNVSPLKYISKTIRNFSQEGHPFHDMTAQLFLSLNMIL